MPRVPLDDKIRYEGDGQYGFGENNIGGVSIDIGKAMLTKMVDDINDSCLLKITILGCGQRAGAIAFMLLTRGIASEIVMYDISGSIHAENEEDEEREVEISNVKNINKQNENVATVRDLETCSLYYPSSAKITMGLDIEDIAGSMIYIITSDFASMKTKFSLSASATNANINKLKENLQYISQNSRPDSIIINAAEPGDLLTYAIWRWTGFPHEKVFGLGTTLAASHLKNEMAFSYNTAPDSCDVVLSGISTKPALIHHSVAFCGAKISDISSIVDEEIEDNQEFWEEAAASGALANKVIQDLKGGDSSSSWGAAAIISKMVDSIVNNSGAMFNVCTHIRGCRHGNKKDVYLSLPAIIGRSGVRYIVKQKMEDEDKIALQDCANLVFNIYPKLDLPGQAPQRDEKSQENSWLVLNKKKMESENVSCICAPKLSIKSSEKLPILVCPCPTESSSISYKTAQDTIASVKLSKRSEMSEEIRVESLCSCLEKPPYILEEPSEKSDSTCVCPASASAKLSVAKSLSEDHSSSICEESGTATQSDLLEKSPDKLSEYTADICACALSAKYLNEQISPETLTKDYPSHSTCSCSASAVFKSSRESAFTETSTITSDMSSQTSSDGSSGYSKCFCSTSIKEEYYSSKRTPIINSDEQSQTSEGTTDDGTSTMSSEISSWIFKSDKSKSSSSNSSAGYTICSCSSLTFATEQKSKGSLTESLKDWKSKVSQQSKASKKTRTPSSSFGSSQTVICDCSVKSEISPKITEIIYEHPQELLSGTSHDPNCSCSVFSNTTLEKESIRSEPLSDKSTSKSSSENSNKSLDVNICSCASVSDTMNNTRSIETTTESPIKKHKKHKPKRSKSKSPSQKSYEQSSENDLYKLPSGETICTCSDTSDESSKVHGKEQASNTESPAIHTSKKSKKLTKSSGTSFDESLCTCGSSENSTDDHGSLKDELLEESHKSKSEVECSCSTVENINMGSQAGSWLAETNKPKRTSGSSIIKKHKGTFQPKKPSKLSRISFDETVCTCPSIEDSDVSDTSSNSYYSAENKCTPKTWSESRNSKSSSTDGELTYIGVVGLEVKKLEYVEELEEVTEVLNSIDIVALANKVIQHIPKDQAESETEQVCRGKTCTCRAKGGECLCYIKVLSSLKNNEMEEFPPPLNKPEKSDDTCICEDKVESTKPSGNIKSDSCICDGASKTGSRNKTKEIPKLIKKLSSKSPNRSHEESEKSDSCICDEDVITKPYNKTKESQIPKLIKKLPSKSPHRSHEESLNNDSCICSTDTTAIIESKPKDTKINEKKPIKKSSSKSPNRSKESKIADSKKSSKSDSCTCDDITKNNSIACDNRSTTATQQITSQVKKSNISDSERKVQSGESVGEPMKGEICSRCFCQNGPQQKSNLGPINEDVNEKPVKSASEQNPETYRCTCPRTSSKNSDSKILHDYTF